MVAAGSTVDVKRESIACGQKEGEDAKSFGVQESWTDLIK